MKKTFSHRRNAFMAMLATLAAAMLVTGFIQSQRVDEMSNQLVTVAQKALYEAEELLGGVQLNLQKLLVSGSPENRQSILDDIIRQSEAAADDISMIAQDQSSLDGAFKFINQVSDYSAALSKKISGGGDLDDGDVRQLKAMLSTCVGLNGELIEGIRKMESGEIEVNFTSETPETQVEPAVNYPVLLYDGPFSDAVDDENFTPSGDEVSSAEASDRLRRFIGENRVRSVTLTGESEIMSRCYEFDVETDSGNLMAGVTAAGGHVLYMLPVNDITEIKTDVASCMQKGLDFLAERGFGQMSVSYWRRQDGIVTVNYAPVENGVLIYPDLIKLQISLADGEVVGAETGGYIRNHVARALPSPVIDEAGAMARINPGVSVNGISLCVIPFDNSEYLCWEVRGVYEGGDSYLIYIDAISGQERTIMRIVESYDGVLTQ